MPGFAHKSIVVLLLPLFATAGVRADTLNVAVASNFVDVLRTIVPQFEAQSGHVVNIIPGASGKLYAQIVNGAPFDVFLSADLRRPEMLEADSLIVAGSRFTYAIGQLVIWSRDQEFAASNCVDALQNLGRKKLAIANPLLAPYGVAAKEYLVGRGLWGALQAKLVFGENIAQTLQFATSGNASVAVIAHSQLQRADDFGTTCTAVISTDEHGPILQQAVELAATSDTGAAIEFLEFLRSSDSRETIFAHGYLLPELQ